MKQKPEIQPLPPGHWLEPGISSEQERLIGRVCVAWSRLEHAMQDVLWQMIGVPIEDGRILTANADASRKLQWLGSFAKKNLAGSELDELKATFALIDAARQDRNFIIHGSWGLIMPGEIPMCMSVKEKGPDPTEIITESFPAERMEDIIRVTDKGRIALMDWANLHARAKGADEPFPAHSFPTKA